MSEHMLFLVELEYVDLERRAEVRSEHLAFLRSLAGAGRVIAAGPCDDGRGRVLLSAKSATEVQRVMSADPYIVNGAVADLRICEWTIAVSADAASVAAVLPTMQGDS